MRWLTRYIILFVLICFQGTLFAQEDFKEQSRTRDSSYVLRSPDADFLEKYKKDAAFDYDINTKPAPGLWDWIKRWVIERLLRMKMSDSSSRVMDGVLYGFLILFAGGLIFWVIKHRKNFILKRRDEGRFSEDLIEYNGEQEVDAFTRMVIKAEQERDYTLAVRVNYSELLQVLDRKQVIRWQTSKTNRDYVYEIRDRAWSRTFEDLTRIFDYVCYGEFVIDESVYRNIKQRFADFRKEVEA